MVKSFFKVFNPETSAKQMKIPPSFTAYMKGKLPKKASLRDGFGNLWPIGVTKNGKDIYFKRGWEKFIEGNILKFGDFFVFDYDGNGIFDVRLFGINGCEKKEIGGLKLVVKEEVTEEMIVEHQKSAEPKGKTLAYDSGSSSSDDDSDEDYRNDDDEDEDEEYEDTNYKAPRSKPKSVEKEEYSDDEEEEENEGVEEKETEEGENKRHVTFKKKAPRLKAGCKRATVCKVSDLHDPFGADIFKSGGATQPKNPYFVEIIRPNRIDRLYVPVDVVRDFKLELPSSMIIRDSAGREVETKVHLWADGRIWLIGGWGSLCRANLVETNDKCICEFVRGERDKDLYLQVQILHEGASSHPNKNNKK